ncbi:MAG: PorV/PorQ family protein [Candidatus Firestonebacteria bacterium]
MRKLLSLIIVCALISPCAALLNKNDAGTTAGQFLKLGMGGKAAAMGDAVVAGVNDSTSIIWNPAGLAGIKGNQLSLMHSLYAGDVFYDYLTCAKEFPGVGTIGIGVQYVNYGSITEMDNLGTELAGFTPYDLAINVAYALNFSGINAGINVKYVSSVIKRTATAFAADLGLQYTVSGVKLGVAAYNLGTGMKFVNDTVGLPVYLRAGAAYSPMANLMVEADGEFPADGAIGFGIGAEYLYVLAADMSVVPRAGYNSINEVSGFKGFTFGLGFNWTTYTLDYALVPFGDMGLVHKMSIGMKF